MLIETLLRKPMRITQRLLTILLLALSLPLFAGAQSLPQALHYSTYLGGAEDNEPTALATAPRSSPIPSLTSR